MSRQSAEKAVRLPILNSWRRCQDAGLNPAEVKARLLDDLDLDSVLARAAQPVLDQVQIAIADTPSAMFLGDASGVLFRRVLGDTAMRTAVDAHGVLPGFSYAESDIGTNAIGSTLMEGRTCQVLGEEHLWEEFQRYAAVGSPVLNPLSGRVEGVVAMASLSERMSTRMTAMVRQTAHEVEQSLLDLSTARERALYRQFLESARTSEAAAVPASTPMPPELCQRDRLAMEDAAVRLVAQGQEAVVEIALSDGRTATVVAQLVTGSTDLTGIAVEAWLA
ncbi:GAF domain-containing protein [Herbidospora mongoliensis]|uniref:GAF domain-containing protein n=1 Tax=Herbidospora mongoliensis TaxID=688067 RepID=UPI000836110F|nr:GAF domain-containing protein [Herbidospora mongoliensis]